MLAHVSEKTYKQGTSAAVDNSNKPDMQGAGDSRTSGWRMFIFWTKCFMNKLKTLTILFFPPRKDAYCRTQLT